MPIDLCLSQGFNCIAAPGKDTFQNRYMNFTQNLKTSSLSSNDLMWNQNWKNIFCSEMELFFTFFPFLIVVRLLILSPKFTIQVSPMAN